MSLESPDLIKGRHLDSFPKQNKHLKVALGELRALKKHGSSLIHIPQKWNRSGDEEAEEQGAAEEDERTFQKASQGFRELKKERKERKERKIQFIQIHNTPDVPRTDIYEISARSM